MTIGIQKIEFVYAKEKINNFKQGIRFGKDENFINQRIGAQELYHLGKEESTVSMATKAAQKLISNSDLNKEDIGFLILVTQNPDHHGIPHNSSIVHDLLGLNKSCIVFDLSLGCSGYIYALNIACGLIKQNNINNGIVLTSDPYSKIINKDEPTTSLLFSDAASATLISKKSRYHLHDFHFYNDGSRYKSLFIKDGELFMNGRMVFNFAISTVPDLLVNFLESLSLQLDSIDYFIFHQGSKVIIDEIQKKLDIQEKKVIRSIDKGNTVSSSIPITLKSIDNKRSNNIVLCGFGVGLSVSISLLKES